MYLWRLTNLCEGCWRVGEAGRGLLGPVWLVTFLGSIGGGSSSSSVVFWGSDSNGLVDFEGIADATALDEFTGKLEFELVSLIPRFDWLFASLPNVKWDVFIVCHYYANLTFIRFMKLVNDIWIQRLHLRTFWVYLVVIGYVMFLPNYSIGVLMWPNLNIWD